MPVFGKSGDFRGILKEFKKPKEVTKVVQQIKKVYLCSHDAKVYKNKAHPLLLLILKWKVISGR